MSRWIKYDNVVALLKAHAKDGDNLTLIGDETAKALENIPSIDICFCRECKWFDSGKNDSEVWSMCTRHWGKYFYVNDDDFCSYGEREGE